MSTELLKTNTASLPPRAKRAKVSVESRLTGGVFPTDPLGLFTFLRTYSRRHDDNDPESTIETPEEAIRRVVLAGNTQLNIGFTDDELVEAFNVIYGLKGTVAGRFLWQLGTKTVQKNGLVSLQNCFSGDTRFWTKDGIRAFEEYEHGDEVMIRGKLRWLPATIQSFPPQEIVVLTINRGRRVETIRTTANHRWIIKPNKGSQYILTTAELRPKMVLPGIRCSTNYHYLSMCPVAIQHGIVFGDGNLSSNVGGCAITLCGDKQELSRFFFTTRCDRRTITGLPQNWKELPGLDMNKEYLYGFLAGWFATDGFIGATGSNLSISNRSPEILEWARGAFSMLDITTTRVRMFRENSPFTGEFSPCYMITIDRDSLPQEFLLLGKHRERFSSLTQKLRWTVKSVEYTNQYEPVWCVSEPENEEFVLDCGVLTKNCAYRTIGGDSNPVEAFTWTMNFLMCGSGVGFRILPEDVYSMPNIKELNIRRIDSTDADFIVPDSREGWIKVLGKVLKGHFYGGEDFTYSLHCLRSKGAPIKGFGGVASGPDVLEDGITRIHRVLNTRIGKKLRPIDCLDIQNIIGQIVVAGNVRRCLPGYTRVHTFGGMKKIDTVNIGDRVLGADNRYYTVSNVFQQGVQDVMEIFTENGSIRSTSNHRHAVYDHRRGVRYVPAAEIEVGMALCRAVWICGDTDGLRRQTFRTRTLPDPLHFRWESLMESAQDRMDYLSLIRSDIYCRIASQISNGMTYRNAIVQQYNPAFLHGADLLAKSLGTSIYTDPDGNWPHRVMVGSRTFIVETVVRISSYADRCETYDIEVDTVHEFFADGFLTHNSAEIALGDCRDTDYLLAKNWGSGNIPNWRSSSNNSVICNDINDVINNDTFWQGYDGTGEPYGLINLDLARSCGRLGDTRYPDPDVQGVNPCLTGDTWISTTEGPRQIQQLINKPFTAILPGNITAECVEGFYRTKYTDELIKISLANGTSIRCTPEHRFAVLEETGEQNWLAASDIHAGKRLITQVPINDPIMWGNTQREQTEYGAQTARTFLMMHEASGLFELSTNLPSKSSRFLRGFLSEYIREYGTAYSTDDEWRLTIRIPEVSGTSLETIVNILTGFRVYAEEVTADETGYTLSFDPYFTSYICWFVVVRSRKDDNVYCDFWRDFIPREALSQYLASTKDSHTISVVSTESQITTFPIPVYDCGIPDTESFIANGVLTHNCGEQFLCDAETCCLAETFLPRAESYEDLIRTLRVLYRFCKHSLTLPCPASKKTENIVHANMRMGIGMTGYLQATEEQKQWLPRAYEWLREYDAEYSAQHGFPPSIKLTTCKPSGCSRKDMLVQTNRGLLRLDEIGDINGEEWQDLTGSGLTVYGDDSQEHEVTKFYVNGTVETRKITTTDGLELESSLQHRYRVVTAENEYVWKTCRELLVGDRLACQLGGHPENNSCSFVTVDSLTTQPTELTPDIAWFLGLFYGVGELEPSGVYFSNPNTEREVWLKEFFMDTFGIEVATHEDRTWISDPGFKEWLRVNGCFGARIPTIIRQAGNECAAAFVGGIWESHMVGGDSRWTVCSVSAGFSQELLVLCRSLGYNVKVRSMGTSNKWLLCLRKLDNASQEFAGRRWEHNNTEFWLDPITSISRSECATYDIEVADVHHYRLGGVVSHNTLSLVGGTTPGVHPGFSPWYIRRVRISSGSPLIDIARRHGLDVEYQRRFDGTRDETTQIISFPTALPEGTVTASEVSAVQQLEYVKRLQTDWSDNAVSVTVYYRLEELEEIKEYLRENYNTGIKSVSFLLHSDHGFDQAPMEAITEEQYNEMVSRIIPITDLSGICYSEADQAIVTDSSACAGGACPLR